MPADEHSDRHRELHTRYHAGDAAAAGELWDLVQPGLKRYADSLSKNDGEDFALQAFYSTLAKDPAEVKNFVAYCLKTVKNSVKREYRKWGARAGPLPDENVLRSDPSIDQEEMFVRLLKMEAALLRCIDLLPDYLHRVVKLRCEGKSFPEIAAGTVSPEAIRQQHQTALKKLRECLAERGLSASVDLE